nr:response regulator [Rhodoferax sp.]
MVADDEPINRALATGVLKRLGHTGVLVVDGAQALQCLEQIKFDLVLMDVMMPNMDGLQALAVLREKERQNCTARLPVFMVTGHDLPGDRERLMQAGADGYVPKPINTESLKSEIQRVLRL